MRSAAVPIDSGARSGAAALCDLLTTARLSAGLSQQKLAQYADVSIGTVRRIEGGSSPEPGFFVIARISRALLDAVDKRDATLARDFERRLRDLLLAPSVSASA